jgi:hypothetical protein
VAQPADPIRETVATAIQERIEILRV